VLPVGQGHVNAVSVVIAVACDSVNYYRSLSFMQNLHQSVCIVCWHEKMEMQSVL